MLGRIYKIVHDHSDAIYVGMSIHPLKHRWNQHKSVCRRGKVNTPLYNLMRTHGVRQFSIALIKEYDVVDSKHLRVYETLWINKLRCINKIPSFCPITRLQRSKVIYILNRDEILKKGRAYFAKHSEALNARAREKLECSCGSFYSRSYKTSHIKTKKHLTRVAAQL